MKPIFRLSLWSVVIFFVSFAVAAQTPVPTFDVKAYYVKFEHLVPMRDDVKLFTVVYTRRRNI